MKSRKSMDLTQGSVPKLLLAFVIPIILTNVLQTLYSAADKIVVGQLAENGALALAAVGSTSSATHLIIGLFNGSSIGVNVVCANLIGAGNKKDLRRAMYTAVLISLLCGLFLAVFGVLMAGSILNWLSTPTDVFPLAKRYMQIVFIGVPSLLLYNFGAAILRSHGDTKRPMYIMIVSGLVNVVLNLVLVLAFRMSVEGVAIATAVSQTFSACWVLKILFDPKDQYQLKLREVRIHGDQLGSIARVGIPSGLGGIVFSVSNVVIQSTANALALTNDGLLAGKAAVSDITGILNQIITAMMAGCVSFAGQCYGAKNYKRIDKMAGWACVLLYMILGVIVGVCVVFAEQVIGLFNTEQSVIESGALLLRIQSIGFVIYIPAEVFLGCSRGMKRATMPTVLNLIGICATRMIWVLFIYPLSPQVFMLFLCYPVSWAMSAILQSSYYFYTRRKIDKQALGG